jgi:hypothetical protein
LAAVDHRAHTDSASAQQFLDHLPGERGPDCILLGVSSPFVAKPCCLLAAASVTFKAQSLLRHALYLFIKLRIFFIEPIVF